jgi:hypothetical protein
LKQATRDEFNSSKAKEIAFYKNENIVKRDKAILIKLKKGEVKFEDDLTTESYQTFEYLGDLIKDKVALIKTQDYSSDKFITLNLSTGDQTIIIGFPHLIGDRIICLQGVETDKVQEIEFWKIKDNKLTKIQNFHIPTEVYPVDIVWKSENEILIKDTKAQYWKAAVSK